MGIDSDAFVAVNIARICVSLLGWALMYTFKLTHGIRGSREQGRGGLPIDKGWRTLLFVANLAMDAPKKGMWVVGHLLCMASSFVGSLYLAIALLLKPDRILGDSNSPAWMQFAIGFRSITTFIIVPACVLQVTLVALGLYIYHRWLGRLAVHLWTWMSILTLVVNANDPTAFGTLVALLAVETVAYFVWKIATEMQLAADRDAARAEAEKALEDAAGEKGDAVKADEDASPAEEPVAVTVADPAAAPTDVSAAVDVAALDVEVPTVTEAATGSEAPLPVAASTHED